MHDVSTSTDCFFIATFVVSNQTLALEGCFCAKGNPAVRKCGWIDRYDPADSVTLREYIPLNCERREAPPIVLSFLNYAECPLAPELNCPVSPPSPKSQPQQAQQPKPVPQPIQDDESFGIEGSNTIGETLMPPLIKGYATRNSFLLKGDQCDGELQLEPEQDASKAITLRCHARGSDTGIPALASGEADIAMLSRPINETEQSQMRRAGFPKMTSIPHETVIGLDGLRIVMSPENPLRGLTLEQIARIFAGQIRDWASLGGTPGAIKLYVRDRNSGTRDTFEALVMEPQGLRISSSAQAFVSSTDL